MPGEVGVDPAVRFFVEEFLFAVLTAIPFDSWNTIGLVPALEGQIACHAPDRFAPTDRTLLEYGGIAHRSLTGLFCRDQNVEGFIMA